MAAVAVNVEESVAPLIGEMVDLLREMNTFLEDVLGIFISEVILKREGLRRHVGKVLDPDHDRVPIPFWTATFSRKGWAHCLCVINNINARAHVEQSRS